MNRKCPEHPSSWLLTTAAEEKQTSHTLLFLFFFGPFRPWYECICDRFNCRQCCDSCVGIFKWNFDLFILETVWNVKESGVRYWNTECCTLTMHGSHTLIKICSYLTTLSTIKSVTNSFISWPEKTKKKRNSNVWEVCFSSADVVSKQLLGCSGHFLCILCHCNPPADRLMCMIYVQVQRTAWNVAFHMKKIFWGNYCK